MRNTLKNKTVVVIGGSSGMGLAVAKQSSQSGARVVIAGRSHDKLKAAAALMLMTNGFITGIVLDVDGGGLIA